MEDRNNPNNNAEERVMYEERPELSSRPEKDYQHTVEFRDRWYKPEDVEEAQRRFEEGQAQYRKQLRDEWAKSAGGRLCLQLHRSFMEYKKYLEENPNKPGGWKNIPLDYPEHVLYQQVLAEVNEYQKGRAEKDRKNLERAHMAARCQHTHLDGRRCGAARVRGQKLCRMHLRMEELQNMKVDLGSLEDPDSIQLAIMKLQRALLDGTLNPGQVRGLSYLVQLAAWNVMRTSVVKGSLRREKQDQVADQRR